MINLLQSYYKMQIRRRICKNIDDWFNRFGYKINRVKIPIKWKNFAWNYVQIGSSEKILVILPLMHQEVFQQSMEIINTIYRNGTTIWHT